MYKLPTSFMAMAYTDSHFDGFRNGMFRNVMKKYSGQSVVCGVGDEVTQWVKNELDGG